MPKPNFEKDKIHEIIRVNYAGEFGAKKIYEGQIKATSDLKTLKLLKEMLAHEQVHLDYFEKQLIKHRIRPTILMPLWNIIGYLLGIASGKLGITPSMILTQAIEEVIEQHYQTQLVYLENNNFHFELAENIKNFLNDEINHKNIAIENNNEKVLFSNLITNIIKNFCKLSIFLSKTI